jgi:hypothetical protein
LRDRQVDALLATEEACEPAWPMRIDHGREERVVYPALDVEIGRIRERPPGAK